MILDESKIVLFPGNEGKDCPGNGTNVDKDGQYTWWVVAISKAGKASQFPQSISES